MNELIFPKRKHFADLFESATRFDYNRSDDGRLEWPMVGDGMITGQHTAGNVITSYFTAVGGDHLSLHVKPKAEIIEWIRRNMIQIDYDHIYFQATMRSDGTALITASYNQIIGSRWLAIIDASTIPHPRKLASQYAQRRQAA